MAENLLNTAGGKSGRPSGDYNSNVEVIGLKLDILGKNVNLDIALMMVKRFLKIVKAMALKNSIPIVEFKKTTTTKTHEQVISF